MPIISLLRGIVKPFVKIMQIGTIFHLLKEKATEIGGRQGIGVFAFGEDTHACRLRASSTRSARSMRTPRLATRGAVVRILYSPARTKKSTAFAVLRSGRGIGIRTPTYRVRVCCAAVTQFPCVITDYILAHIIWFVNSFFEICLQNLFIFLLKKRVCYVIMVRVIYLSVRAGTFFARSPRNEE